MFGVLLFLLKMFWITRLRYKMGERVIKSNVYIYPVLHIEWTTLTVQSDKLFMLAIDYKHTI